jgi:hypothetical protein
MEIVMTPDDSSKFLILRYTDWLWRCHATSHYALSCGVLARC